MEEPTEEQKKQAEEQKRQAEEYRKRNEELKRANDIKKIMTNAEKIRELTPEERMIYKVTDFMSAKVNAQLYAARLQAMSGRLNQFSRGMDTISQYIEGAEDLGLSEDNVNQLKEILKDLNAEREKQIDNIKNEVQYMEDVGYENIWEPDVVVGSYKEGLTVLDLKFRGSDLFVSEKPSRPMTEEEKKAEQDTMRKAMEDAKKKLEDEKKYIEKRVKKELKKGGRPSYGAELYKYFTFQSFDFAPIDVKLYDLSERRRRIDDYWRDVL